METALTGPGGRYDCPTADKRNVRCMLHPDLDDRLNDTVGRVAKSFLLEELLARALDGPVSVADVLADLRRTPRRNMPGVKRGRKA